ncbi:GNAT family N-acetyltransferase [Robertmurraya sp. FSL R5-0851]|uniref:GNAT family N-acetyltransferase n=1 Tax=Robertmurraya sp. FSL R5-0851 TaxID=2921584 RepID=UPI001369FEDE
MFSKRITHQEDLQKAFSIREKVFVDEQDVPLEEEFDQFDTLGADCEHILVYYQEEAVGTGRVRFVYHFGKLERICILEEYRKYGLGKMIISTLEEIALEKGMTHAKLHGQTQAEGFYKKLGYHTASDVFMDANIPHVLMKKDLTK